MPTTNLSPSHPYLLTEQIIHSMRSFFVEHGFHEVLIPALHQAIPLEANIYPFTTEWQLNTGNKTLFLATSPERTLKIMLAEGLGDCFGIGHTFRNLEAAGTKHTPEFLMLEWYRQNADYTQIMSDVQELILFCNQQLHQFIERTEFPIQLPEVHFSTQKWPLISFVDLFSQYIGVSLKELTEPGKIEQIAKKKDYQTENATWSQLFDQLFLNEIEPHLPHTPFFLVDFPSLISPLCKIKKDHPYLSERFELYIQGVEIANGNSEATDSDRIRKQFMSEAEKRKTEGRTAPIDEQFLSALKTLHGQQLAGIGLGVERLILLLTGQSHIHQVQSLPLVTSEVGNR